MLAVFRLLVNTGIYFQHYSPYTLYILFQAFTLCSNSGFSHCARYCGYIQYYSESISLEYASVFPGSILWIYSEYSQYLAFSGTALILPVLAVFRPPVLLQNSQYSQHEINIPDTPSILGTFVATLAATLAALAAAAPLANLLLMCHPLQQRPKECPCWHASQRFAFLTLPLYTTSSSTTAVLQILLLILQL